MLKALSLLLLACVLVNVHSSGYNRPPPPPPPSYNVNQYSSMDYSTGYGHVLPYGQAPPRPKCDVRIDLTHLPGNCRKFRRCANGILYIMNCPADLVFDDRIQVCNYKRDVPPPCGNAKYSNTQQYVSSYVPNY